MGQIRHNVSVMDKTRRGSAFAEIKPEDTKYPRVLFHKRKHHSEFVLSSLKSFKGSLYLFDKIIQTSDE